MTRARSARRCGVCRLLSEWCLCGDLPRVRLLSTRLVLVQHASEARSTTNSAHFCSLLFPETIFIPRGQRDSRLLSHLPTTEARSLLLFPDESAEVLDTAFVARNPGPYRLVIPDGRWTQARRMVKREPALSALPRVKLADGAASRFGVRKAQSVDLLSTFESVARALGVLEGPEIEAEMERFFGLLSTRFLRTRGVPDPGSRRHLPLP